MIEGGKYHDSLEKLFTLQTIAESTGLNRYKVVTFDFGSKIFGDLAKPERFFIFLDSCICLFLKVAWSFESD